MNRKAFACVLLAFVFALVAAGAQAQSKKRFGKYTAK